MGKRDEEMNLGLPEELYKLVASASETTGDPMQGVVRDALRDYLADLDFEENIEARITALEAREQDLDEQIEEKRDELRELQDEREDVRDELDRLREQRANVEDTVSTMDEAVEDLASEAEALVGTDERLMLTDEPVADYADQFGTQKTEILERVYAEHPEIPRSCLDGGVVIEAEREYESREQAIELIAEYVEREGRTSRVRAMIDDVADVYGVMRKDVRDEVAEVVGDDVFAVDA